ncbi:MAG: VOC family protein [Actinomycetota bacterium]
MLRVDHALIGAVDLERAARDLLEEHGLASVEGGRHMGLGTANRIVPLGAGYVELIAVVDPEEAMTNPFGSWIQERVSVGEGPIGVCLATDDIERESKRLDLEPLAMSRTRPDGTELRWRLAGLAEAISRGLPFFIQWDIAPELHPGRTPASHRVAVEGIAWVELAGDEGTIRSWVGEPLREIRITDGAPAVRSIAIRADGREIVLR